MCGLLACFLVLVISLILSTNQLQSMTVRILVDSKAIEAAHIMEASILKERREELLWRKTGDDHFLLMRKPIFDALDTLLLQLPKTSTSTVEDDHIDRINKSYTQFRLQASADMPADLTVLSRSTNELLAAVEAYRELNRAQMTATMSRSDRLNRLVDRCSLGLIIFVFLTMALGAVQLVKRIIIPVSSIRSTVVRFGQGELDVKIAICREDELGILSRAFNEMAESIASLQQEKRHVIATLAHDLKNPLVLIGATARRMKKKQFSFEEQMPLLERIIDQIDFVEELIHEMMDAVHIEDGSFSFEIIELQLEDLVRTIMEKQTALITTHRLVYACDCDCNCPIMGDAQRLERVLANLISNAVKYSNQESLVSVSLHRRGNLAQLSVKDEGIGFEHDQIPLLFKPFTRLSHTKHMARGTGLGLYSVKRIIDSHGGSIIVESRSGIGTTVTLELPLKTIKLLPVSADTRPVNV